MTTLLSFITVLSWLVGILMTVILIVSLFIPGSDILDQLGLRPWWACLIWVVSVSWMATPILSPSPPKPECPPCPVETSPRDVEKPLPPVQDLPPAVLLQQDVEGTPS